MKNQQTLNSIRLVAHGKYWGTLRLNEGRLMLDCQRHGHRVEFDLLASVEQGQAVTGELVLVRHCVAEDDHA